MNTEEIARIVGDQRAYFKTHATFDVDARRRALVSFTAMRCGPTRPISLMRSRPIWESRMTRPICARFGTSLSEIRHQIAHVADGVVRACVRATSLTP